jgi:RecB family exonuclease
LIIFTNRRGVRNFKKRFENENRSFENLITIEEFLKRAIFVDGFRRVNRLEREVIFNSVVKRVRRDIFSIDTDIFNFLSYSKYFFSFFEELAVEGVEISYLKDADYYEDYKTHISILEEIFEKYKIEMEKFGYLDSIFTPKNYELNLPYIKSFKKIEYIFEGRFTNFQLELFNKISNEIPIYLNFVRSKFNSKIEKQLEMEFEPNFEYRIEWKSRKILSKRKVSFAKKIDIYSFQNRISQVGFVKEKIFKAVESGVSPEKIGVILLEESFATTLQKFDIKRNLNFAMGFSIKESQIYLILNAIYKSLTGDSKENSFRLKRILEEEAELFLYFSKNWEKRDLAGFREILKGVIEKSLFKKIFPIWKLFLSDNLEKLPVKVLLKLFLKELEEISIDDTKGGKITVLGLLETRGAEFETVIILDFNDEVFPKREEKDFFINSDIRRDVKLPLIEDREALQKLYLQRVFQKAEAVYISYVSSETTKISRFFHDFNFREKPYNKSYEKHLLEIVLPKSEVKNHWREERVLENYKFSKRELSNSKLRNFLECRRGFYFKYILGIEKHILDRDPNLEVGNLLHTVLNLAYRDVKSFETIYELEKSLQTAFDEVDFENLYKDFWLQKLERFAKNEILRFQSGVRISLLEVDFETEYRGFKFIGRVDRVDILPDGNLLLIDYKTKEPTKFYNSEIGKKEHDFQLLFYYILLSENGYKVDLENLFYYNLSEGKLIPNSRTLEEFHEVLESLKTLEKEKIDFHETVECSSYCEFKIVCNR